MTIKIFLCLIFVEFVNCKLINFEKSIKENISESVEVDAVINDDIKLVSNNQKPSNSKKNLLPVPDFKTPPFRN